MFQRGRRQRQKKVVREAREEENRLEAEQQVEEDAIEAEEEARPDAQAEEDEARPDGQAEEEARPDAQTEEEARTDAHTEAVEPEAERHEDDAHTEASVVHRGRGRGRQQRRRHDEVPVGPEDPSLLKDFRNHVAANMDVILFCVLSDDVVGYGDWRIQCSIVPMPCFLEI
ncbi:hypothetical protein RHGRI_005188 [Rhododendron griersonianum]|uniref:Uncharacterized protein n=1 Tax=Rhododendron griersonianum TaxID=479676 RepID=A0AAV6LCC3_9ERIC|nr:hypothetical protein RHGRI_005188 [Rhododendron griersonianum]